jgi:hypothetical protein
VSLSQALAGGFLSRLSFEERAVVATLFRSDGEEIRDFDS